MADAKSSTASKSTSSGFKLPSLWPASEQKKVTKRSTEPSAWDKFSSESKAMLDKTTDAITFWDNDKPAAKSHAPDSVRNRFGVKKKEEEKKSFFSGWFSGKEEEPPRPRTVSEFLNQDKPQP